jgi:hypothetical protein
MNDDWSDPTGEHEQWTMAVPANDTGPVVTQDEPDPIAVLVALDGVSERDARVVDSFYKELAREASEDTSPATMEEQSNIDAIAAFTERLMTTPPSAVARARRSRRRPES